MKHNAIFSSNKNATDSAFLNLYKAESEMAKRAKELTEELWSKYYQYADEHFLTEIRHSFCERFWEMYLACTLMEQGIPISCPKPGPDILIETDNKIWIEAIAPSQGDTSNPDRVPDVKYGTDVAYEVPDEKIILRLRGAIKEKFNNKYHEYKTNNIINDTDIYVIAINGRQIPHAISDLDPPRILRSVFPIGHQEVVIDTKTNKIIESRFQYRDNIVREKGAKVTTDIFLDEDYRQLSGIIYSMVDAGNTTPVMGQDYIFIHNPLALNPFPKNFFKFGEEIIAHENGEEYSLERIKWN